MDNLIKAEAAITFIPSDDRDVWISVGMAIKSEFGEEGFHMWDNWSQNSSAYKPKDAKAVWKSFRRGGGTTIASLFFLARQNGYRDTSLENMSPEDKKKAQAEYRIAAEKRRKQDEKDAADKLRMNENAKRKAAILLSNAEVAEHAYLKSKQLPEITGFVIGDVLLVPLRTLDGELTGCQMIWWNDAINDTTDIYIPGEKPISFSCLNQEEEGFIKKFIPGTAAKGSVFRIGNKHAPATIICEGYATGLSIAKAAHLMRQDVSVLVCFSAFNTMYVSNLIKGRKRGIFADYDESRKGEDYAKKAKVAYVMSDVEKEDANDIMVKHGIFVLAEKARQLINNMR